jgi:hypothetical protein
MCAAPISAADAAWTEADAAWERLQVEAAEAFAANDLVGAAASYGAALRTARGSFPADDPRLATSLANRALALRLRGEPGPDRLFSDALKILDEAPAWLARQRFAPRARSSIFHLRLEARHPGAYDANLRRRALTLLNEARGVAAALAAGAAAQAPDPIPLRALRSAPKDAMCKVLAAVHLLATPVAPQDAKLGAREGL